MSPAAAAPTLPWIEEASARFVDIMPDHIGRLNWTAEQLRAHQDRAVADLVRTAATWSPFHRRRLAGVGTPGPALDTNSDRVLRPAGLRLGYRAGWAWWGPSVDGAGSVAVTGFSLKIRSR